MKPTTRVVYAAGQILAKINFTMTAQKLRRTAIELLEKSPFHDNKLNEWDSFPNCANRDSDTEDISDKKYGAGGATPPSFDCPADEVLGNSSMVFTPETITALVEYFTQLSEVVLDPGSIAQITAKVRFFENQFF